MRKVIYFFIIAICLTACGSTKKSVADTNSKYSNMSQREIQQRDSSVRAMKPIEPPRYSGDPRPYSSSDWQLAKMAGDIIKSILTK